MGLRINHRDIRTSDLADSVLNRSSDRGEYLGASVVNSFLDNPILGRIIDNNAIAINDGRKARALPSFMYDDPEPVKLTPEEQKASPDYRESMGIVDGATAGSMKFRAEQTDARAWRDQLIAKRDAGALDKTLGFAAQLVGSAADPINYVPIVGEAMRLAFLARAGSRAAYLMRGTALGALEGFGGNLVAAPFTANLFASRGRDYGLEDLAADLAFGAAAGGTFGGFGAAMEGRPARVADAARIEPPRPLLEAPSPLPNVLGDLTARDAVPVERAAPPSPADGFVFGFGSRENAPPAPRMADAAKAAESLELATHQVLDGEHVDVGKLAPTQAAPDRAAMVAQFGGDTFQEPWTKRNLRVVDDAVEAKAATGEDVTALATSRGEELAPKVGPAIEAELAGLPVTRPRNLTVATTGLTHIAIAPDGRLFVLPTQHSDLFVRVADKLGLKTNDPESLDANMNFLAEESPFVVGRFTNGKDGLGGGVEIAAGLTTRQAAVIQQLKRQAPGKVSVSDNQRPPWSRDTPAAPAPLSDTSRGTPIPDDDAAMKAELRQEPPGLMAAEFPEIADFNLRKEQGLIHPDDMAAFDAATAEAARMENIELAYDQAAACVIGAAGL